MSTDKQQLLVENAVKGNKQALAELCESKARGVLFVCTKMMGNSHDGEDAAQEVFLRLYRHIGKLKNPASFSVWLHRMVLNTCNSMRVKNMYNRTDLSMEEYGEAAMEADLEYIPQAYLEKRENRAALDEIIDRLPPNYKMCILLYYFEEMRYEEIAQVLNISTKAVSNNLYRAKLAIREEIRSRDASELPCQAPLAAFFALCAEDTVSGAAVAKCVAIGTGAAMGALAKGTVLALVAGLVGLAATAGTVLLLALPVSGNTLAFTPADGEGVSQNVPQHFEEEAFPGGSVEDSSIMAEPSAATTLSPGASRHPQDEPEAPVESAASLTQAEASPDSAWVGSSSIASSSAPAASVPGVAVEDPAPAPAPTAAPSGKPGGVLTPVSGRLLFKNAAGALLEDISPYLAGTTVRLYNAQGALLDETTADTAGKFTLSRIYLAQAEACTLTATLPGVQGLAFAKDNPGGMLALTLTPGQAPASAPTFYVTDTAAPSLGVTLYDAAGRRSQMDVARAEILAADMLPVTCRWRITAQSGTVLYSGTGTEVADAFSQLAASQASGYYSLTVRATDAAGNTAETSTTFLLT